MKKLLVIALLISAMLVGCKSESTEDVQAILPEPTTVAVEEDTLDVSEFVDMKLPIDSRSFYMNLGLGESSMDIAGRGSIVYMGTSVADMSMSFWYDTETSQIKFESKAGDEAEYFEGPISSESVEAQTDTGIDVLKLVSADSVEKVDDLIEITGDISMGDQEYSGAKVKLYDDRTLHSVTAENEDGTIEVYSLLKDDSKFPAIPDVEYTSITEEEADEKIFASVMLLMAGALSTLDESDLGEEGIYYNINMSDVAEENIEMLQVLDYVDSSMRSGEEGAVTLSVHADDVDTAITELEQYGTVELDDECTVYIMTSDFSEGDLSIEYNSKSSINGTTRLGFDCSVEEAEELYMTLKEEIGSLESIIDDLEFNAFAHYDDSKCSGVDVISAIRSYVSEGMTIIVEEADGSVYGFGAELASLLYDVVYTEDSSFIEHTGSYTSTLIEGDTGVVGIHFKPTSEEELVEEFGTN